MKVIHLDTAMDWRGGQSQVLMLARGLLEQGIESWIVTKPGSALGERATAMSIPVAELPLRFEVDLPSAFSLARLISNSGPVILHAHTPHALGIVLSARIFGRANPVVFTRRVSFPVKSQRFSRWKLNRADRVIAVSQSVATVMKQCGIESDKIRVVHSAVDIQMFQFCGPSLTKPFNIVIPGAIEKAKGIDMAFDFIRLCNGQPVKFHFVGKGPDLPYLNEFAREHASVEVHGFRENMDAVLKGMFACFSFSPSEGFPNALLQSMASGLPVIAFENPAVRELLSDDKAGFLFHDLSQAFDLLQQLLLDTQLASQIGKRASERVRAEFSVSGMIEKMLAVYQEVLKE